MSRPRPTHFLPPDSCLLSLSAAARGNDLGERQYFYLGRITSWDFAARTGPEFSEPGTAPPAHLRVLLDGLPVFERYGLLLAGGYAFRAHEILHRPGAYLGVASASRTP
jgi:hypothetical protein